MEIWKVYKKTQRTVWEVSNYGNVKMNGDLYECGITASGYVRFGRAVYLHKVVAELFIPNTDNKPHVDHIDTNKLNNHVDNLRWVTQSENCNNPLTLQHTSEAKKDIPKSEEHKQKISETMKGKKNAAKKCIFRDKEFDCVKDAQTYAKSIGVSGRNFRKELIIL